MYNILYRGAAMKSSDWLEVMRYLSLVTWLGLTMAVSVWLGWWLGGLAGGTLWPLVGVLAGVGGGFAAAWGTLKKMIPWE